MDRVKLFNLFLFVFMALLTGLSTYKAFEKADSISMKIIVILVALLLMIFWVRVFLKKRN